jgi:ankyrin repeat protein
MKSHVQMKKVLVYLFLVIFLLPLMAQNGSKLIEAIMYQEFDKAKDLVKNGADLEMKANDGTTVFTQACMGVLREKVTITFVQTLIDKGANVDEAPTSGRSEGYTRLMMAARNKQPDLVKLLVKNGADVNKMSKDGKTALSLAEKKNDQEMISLLKSLGAK